MRNLLGCCLCLVLGWAATAFAATGKLERVSIAGRDYVRLADWADSYQFKLAWLKPQKEAQVTSRWSKLVFTVDSTRVEFNGVAVWLSFPVAWRSGEACVSVLDLNTAIHPVLFPPRNPKGQAVKTICLDPGHGGRDPGNQARNSQEKQLTLLLAQEVQRQLKEAGFKVVMTRTSDKFVDLEWRPVVAQRAGADLFVSLHFNGAPGAGARGAEVFCLTPAGASSTNARGEGATAVRFPGNRFDEFNNLLAFSVQKGLLKTTDAEDRGLRRARFAVLRYATVPAVLVEGGFLSDPAEAARINSAAYRRQMAKGIVDGIREYKQLVER